MSAQVLKSHLVRDKTIAQISRLYGVPRMMKSTGSSFAITRQQTKAQASMFEAYVAAVFYSHAGAIETQDGQPPQLPDVNEVQRGETPAKEVVISGEAETKGPITNTDDSMAVKPPSEAHRDNFPCSSTTIPAPFAGRGEAYDFVDQWLRALFTPIARYMLDFMKKEQAEQADALKRKRTPTIVPASDEVCLPTDASAMSSDATPSGPSDDSIPSQRSTKPRDIIVAEQKPIEITTGVLNGWAMKNLSILPAYVHESLPGGLWKATCHLRVEDGREW